MLSVCGCSEVVAGLAVGCSVFGTDIRPKEYKTVRDICTRMQKESEGDGNIRYYTITTRSWAHRPASPSRH